MFWAITLGALPTVMNQALAHLVRAAGHASQASFGVALGGVMNILLDPIFIFTFRLEVAEPDIFIGGDCATGPMYTIDAIATGREGAVSIHRFVNVGQSLTLHRNTRKFKELDKNNVLLGPDSYKKPARNLHRIDKAKVRTMSDERLTFTEEQIKSEASRCLSCGRSVVDPNKCIGCGICTTKCEFDAIHLRRLRPECTHMVPAEDKVQGDHPLRCKAPGKDHQEKPSE